MTRITVDVNDEWLASAKEVLGTDSKVATINEALRLQALRAQAETVMSLLAEAEMDFSGSVDSFGYNGGRALDRLEEEARSGNAA